MISAAELTAMRADLTASLPGTVTISRVSLSSDRMGGQSEAWATVGTAVARVSPSGAGTDDIVGAEALSQIPWVVTVPQGTDVTERDRIIYEGQTFEVIRTTAPRSWDTCTRCDCMEVT